MIGKRNPLLGKFRKVRKYCCGNPRKWFGRRTRQELKVLQDELLPLLPPDPKDYHEILSSMRNEMDRVCGVTILEDPDGVILVVGKPVLKP